MAAAHASAVQVLPPGLRRLVITDCPRALPLALARLEVLVMQASTMRATELAQVQARAARVVLSRCRPACGWLAGTTTNNNMRLWHDHWQHLPVSLCLRHRRCRVKPCVCGRSCQRCCPACGTCS
jgi:hypothetical protein